MQPLVSVIIVNYNTPKLTVDAVRSVIREKEVSKEIIIVDNGSDKNSLIPLNHIAEADRNIKLIKNKNNLGFAKANNQGIRIAKGKYILLLNSDTVVKRGAFKNMVDFARKTKDAGVVGPRLINADGKSIQPSCLNFPTITNAYKEYFTDKEGLFNKFAPKKASEPVVVDAVVGAAFLITPQALEKVGMLDERYFFYFEDIDYCRKVWKNGLKVYYLPTAKIIHYHGASGKDLAGENVQWKRLIPGSKVYHGVVGHCLLNAVLWLGQKKQKYLDK